MTVGRTHLALQLLVGPYEGLGAAYQALEEWAGDHGYAHAGPHREHYLTGPDLKVPPAEYRSEIDMPITPLAAVTEADEPEPAAVR